MKTMTYKGYQARIEYDSEDRILVGRVLGVRDIIGFHGTTVDELEADFRAAIDIYLAVCAKRRERPEKPYSGKMLLRVPPELHASAAIAAEASGTSLNQWAIHVLEEAANGPTSRPGASSGSDRTSSARRGRRAALPSSRARPRRA
jgi:predicted HicB family RNase H-like nuclease